MTTGGDDKLAARPRGDAPWLAPLLMTLVALGLAVPWVSAMIQGYRPRDFPPSSENDVLWIVGALVPIVAAVTGALVNARNGSLAAWYGAARWALIAGGVCWISGFLYLLYFFITW